MTTARLAEVPLPEFGLPTEQPVVPAATYAARLAVLRSKARAAGHDIVVVLLDQHLGTYMQRNDELARRVKRPEQAVGI